MRGERDLPPDAHALRPLELPSPPALPILLGGLGESATGGAWFPHSWSETKAWPENSSYAQADCTSFKSRF